MTEQVEVTKPARKPAAKKAVSPPQTKPFKSVEDIKLGMIVRDPASGLQGVCQYKAELLSGTVQYAIQPVGDGKTVHEALFVDDFMLEFVEGGVSERAPAPDKNAKFILGEELEDTVSGFRGIAIERTTYLNGCVHYTLQPPNKERGFLGRVFQEPAPTRHFDHKRLKKTGQGLAPPPTAKEPEPKPFKRSETGGPMRSARIAALR